VAFEDSVNVSIDCGDDEGGIMKYNEGGVFFV
jgi:hypothetical protein